MIDYLGLNCAVALADGEDLSYELIFAPFLGHYFRYVFKIHIKVSSYVLPLTGEVQRILAYVRKHGFIRRAEAQERAGQKDSRGPRSRACQGLGVLRAAEGPVRQANMPLRQARRGAARAVLVPLLEEGRKDEEQVCGEEQAYFMSFNRYPL